MFIERKQELETLLALAQRAASGRGAVALVRGEAGIGKTSLITALREQAHDGPVFWGGCEALFTPRPLGPLYDMANAMSDRAFALIRNGASPRDVFESVADELSEIADGAIFVVEDIHWADYATLELLKYLGRRVSALPVLFILSYRHDEIDADSQTAKILAGFPAAFVHEIDLQPLSRKGVERLCFAAGHKSNSAEYYEVSGGNPFFVNELLASEDAPGAALPASIKDAVATRLSRLTATEREFLETLSLIPGAIPQQILKPLFAEDGELLAMAALGRKMLVETGSGGLRFRHELARLATMARVPATRQRAIHARLTAALLDAEDFTPAFDQLVHHAAGALDADSVLEFAPRAAEIAATVGAHREAAAHLATAMRFVDEAAPDQAAEIYEKWAYEAGIALQIDEEVIDARRHAVTLWRALGRMDRVADNLRWLSRLHWYRAEAAEAARYADEAVRILEETPPSASRAMGYSLKSQLHMLSDEMQAAIEWGEKALALADEFNDSEVRVHALNNVGVARSFREDRRGVDLLEESLAISLEKGFHEHAARVYTNLSEYGVEFKEFELAERVISEGIAFDTRHDLDSWTHYLVGRKAQLRCEQGWLRDARTIAEGVLRLDHLTLLMKLPARLVLAKVETLTNEEKARQVLSSVTEHAAATEEPQHIVPAHLVRLLFAELFGHARMKEESLYRLFDIGPDAMHCWHRGEVALWGHRFGHPAPQGFTGNLPEPVQLEIDGDIAEAAKCWESLGAPVSRIVTLMRSNEQPDLANALSTAREIGATTIEDFVLRRANALGIAGELPTRRRGPYAAARDHPLGLTRKEQAVLALIVEGRPNPEIADIMSRSKRTVENHVSAILRKLKVETRMEAAMRVQAEPWLLPEENGNQ